MSDKKQSSVEWLILEIKKRRYVGEFVPYSLFEQAKAMHKSEMSKTWDSALDAGQERAWNVMRAYSDFDEYYENTFEK